MRDELVIGDVLTQLLVATMQISELRHTLLDSLAIEPEKNAEHAMGRRMLRPHVQNHRVVQRIAPFERDGSVLVHYLVEDLALA